MAKWLIILGIITSLVVLQGCFRRTNTTPSGYQNIDFDSAVEMLGTNPAPVVIDVRNLDEFTGELGHIPGARLIPLPNLIDSINSLSGMKNGNIIMVCRSGRRSSIACGKLAELGFKKLYNLSGGMLSWAKNGGKTE